MAAERARPRARRGALGGGAVRPHNVTRWPRPCRRATGRQVDVKVVVDPSVVGGVVARVGDEVFDGSVASRLEDAKQRLGSV